MKQTIVKWQRKFQQWMIGRYGIIDKLNKHLMIAVIVLILIQLFVKSTVLSLIELVFLIFILYRTFSKRIYVRSNENQKYCAFLVRLKHPIENIKIYHSNRKKYKYITCKTCKKKMRVPRGHGKVRVTCPSCSTKVEINTK